ncbi:MAG: hypothetical protein ABJB76_02140 [Candidatus Nitrosocosmicus sp.]
MSEYNATSIQSGKQYLSLILNSKIPDHLNWTVKMWHFGKDSLTGYSDEKFEIFSIYLQPIPHTWMNITRTSYTTITIKC